MSDPSRAAARDRAVIRNAQSLGNLHPVSKAFLDETLAWLLQHDDRTMTRRMRRRVESITGAVDWRKRNGWLFGQPKETHD